MALEAQTIADTSDAKAEDRRARSERRGRERRRPGARVNKGAPRHSIMKGIGALATGLSVALFAIVMLGSALVLEQTPWIALAVTGAAVIVSIFALILGCIEQRLIEIRLELMMANGGMRSADRRQGDRRGIESRASTSPSYGGDASETRRRASE